MARPTVPGEKKPNTTVGRSLLFVLLSIVLGFLDVFAVLRQHGQFAPMEMLAGGIWKSLICTAAGLAVAIPSYAGYNYLVSRVNSIVLDMEKVATEIVNIVNEIPPQKSS